LDPSRVVAIPRGVDLDRFDPGAINRTQAGRMRAQWAAGGRAVVLLPARLTRWKGQLVLVDAMALLEKRRPGLARAVLAGDAQGREEYVAEVELTAARNGLRDVVSIVGHLNDVPAALAASDIAVFPSIEPEAFGRGAVEAQAMGVPVIASNYGGL